MSPSQTGFGYGAALNIFLRGKTGVPYAGRVRNVKTAPGHTKPKRLRNS